MDQRFGYIEPGKGWREAPREYFNAERQVIIPDLTNVATYTAGNMFDFNIMSADGSSYGKTLEIGKRTNVGDSIIQFEGKTDNGNIVRIEISTLDPQASRLFFHEEKSGQ